MTIHIQGNSLLLLTTFLSILTACQLLPPYQSPFTRIPEQWKGKQDIASDEEGKTQNEPCFEEVCSRLDNWWEVFQDPVLNELEQQALNSSYTLWAAFERVLKARAIARINFAPLMPSVNFAPSFFRIGSLIENAFQNLNITGAPIIPSSFRFVQSQYLIPFNFNYEVDLWCKLHNAYYGSTMLSEAASQAYLSVLLSLTADIASTYFQIRGLDLQQEVIQKNIHVRQRALDINRARFNAGLIVYLDVSQAEVDVARTHSDSDDTRRLRELQENILATLCGIPAPLFSIKYNPISSLPPTIPAGLPSELLRRRPDIAEAERTLAATYYDIGVAYANFFPSLNLNAALGVESPFPHQLFSWKSRYWQVGLNIFQTVFDGGKNQANLDYYKANFKEAFANYQETVLQSFKDAEDALTNIHLYANQAHDLAIASEAAKKTLHLSQTRYNKGLVSYLYVVNAQRQLLEIEQESAFVLTHRYLSTVMLIRALGGGWGEI